MASMHAQSVSKPSTSFTSSLSRSSTSVPNEQGTKAIYTVSTQTPESHADITEIRIMDYLTGTSTLFSDDPRNKEATWLGKDDLVLWLKDVEFGATEFWIADAEDAAQNCADRTTLSKRTSVEASCTQPATGYCAGRISAKAFYPKLHTFYDKYIKYDDIAMAVACPTTSNGSLYNPDTEKSASEVHNAIWYTTLRMKAMSSTTDLKYIISPTRFNNALIGTGLESPLRSPSGQATDFDISTRGIVFLARAEPSCAAQSANVNIYYIPLKTFTEMSRPPQIINVKGFEGRSPNAVLSPSGHSVASARRRDLADSNDSFGVIVDDSIRDFRAPRAIDDVSTLQCGKDQHLSPYSVAWSENGEDLHVIAMEAGIPKLFKISALISSIRTMPDPITSDSTAPADVKLPRTAYSTPKDVSLDRSLVAVHTIL